MINYWFHIGTLLTERKMDSSISTLIPELLVIIFNMLDTETQCLAKRVCKQWSALLPKYKLCSMKVYAAEHGYLNLLQWIKLNGYTMNSNVCLVAARNNRREILEWLMEQEEFDWLREMALGCVEGGHLEILRWVEEMGYRVGTNIGILICSHGHLELLKYWHQKGGEIDGTWYIQAIALNQLAIIQHLRSINVPWNKEVCLSLSQEYGYMELVDWIREN